jgi:hypothetical protein
VLRTGLVQQTDQIVASHDLSLFVGRSRYAEDSQTGRRTHDLRRLLRDGVVMATFTATRYTTDIPSTSIGLPLDCPPGNTAPARICHRGGLTKSTRARRQLRATTKRLNLLFLKHIYQKYIF